ncbi:MAG: S16 family serine protease, partial [archaeon]
MNKLPMVLAFIILFSLYSFAALNNGEISIYAVTTEGKGLVATLHLQIDPGTGKIWSAVTPLVGTTTQNAERTAIKVAKNYFSGTDNYDYKFSINSTASIVEGPSAGAAMTLLAVTMLKDKAIPKGISMTGTINEDGSVGPVGGVFEKAKEASSTGVKLFMIPKGEAVQTVRLEGGVKSVNILDYAPKNWGLKVVEVQTIDDALVYAFSDIKKIDVNTSAVQAIPEFIPEKIPIPQHLGTFKVLTSNYINKINQLNGEARNALSSSLLEDPEVTNLLLEALNNSEQTLQHAEVLNEQNYLYSAANFAFLAGVNSIIVKEVSNNPALLRPSSSAFDLKILGLKKEMGTFEKQLNGNVPRKGVEWYASAQQRFTYAKNSVDRLVSEQTIVVNGSQEGETALAFQRLQDYAFAVAWLDVSKDFYNLSRETDGYVPESGQFSSSMDSIIEGAEKDVNALGDSPAVEDIQRRIDAAKTEKKNSWFEASYFDAVSAKALAKAELDVQDKGYQELKQTLENKISGLEAKMNSNEQEIKVSWAVLYLDHAKYFLASANYYDKSDLNVNAANNVKSGISLIYLAEDFFDASNAVVTAYSSLPIVSTDEDSSGNSGSINSGSPLQVRDFTQNLVLYGLALILLAVLIVLSVLLVTVIRRSSRKKTLEQEIREIKELLAKNDAALSRRTIGAQAHAKLKDKYEGELSLLESERKVRAEHLLAADEYSSEIDSYKERAAGLQKHLRENAITKEEFSRKYSEYQSKVSELREELDSELKELDSQKKEIESGVKEIIESHKKLLPVSMGNEGLSAQKGPKDKRKKTGKWAAG